MLQPRGLPRVFKDRSGEEGSQSPLVFILSLPPTPSAYGGGGRMPRPAESLLSPAGTICAISLPPRGVGALWGAPPAPSNKVVFRGKGGRTQAKQVPTFSSGYSPIVTLGSRQRPLSLSCSPQFLHGQCTSAGPRGVVTIHISFGVKLGLESVFAPPLPKV